MLGPLFSDPSLKKHIQVVPAGECLFRQGEWGNTMFIIIEGIVVLYQKTLNLMRLVDSIGPGEILGEKAVFLEQPYKRTLTAKAKTELTVLELDTTNIKMLQHRVPTFTAQVLRLVTERLDKSNELVGILQLEDSVEKMIQFLLHLCRHAGQKVTQGVEVLATISEISETLAVQTELVDDCLKALIKQRIIAPKRDGYIIYDETALLTYLPTLKDLIAA